MTKLDMRRSAGRVFTATVKKNTDGLRSAVDFSSALARLESHRGKRVSVYTKGLTVSTRERRLDVYYLVDDPDIALVEDWLEDWKVEFDGEDD